MTRYHVIYERDSSTRFYILASPFHSLPPSIDILMQQQGDGNQLYVIEHRRLAYLGKILRSWQRAALEQQIFPFPLYEDVTKATATTTASKCH